MSSDAMKVSEAASSYVAGANAQDVPPGYKRTEVGVIPFDWRARQLGEFGALKSGSGFPVKYQGRLEGDYPFFKVSDMNNPGNELFMESSNNWIAETLRKELSAEALPPGSIVFAKIGAAIFLERKKLLVQDSCLDNNMMAYILTDRSASSRFFHYVLLRIELGRLVSTTALPSLSGREIASVRVPVPPPQEQQAIAEVLADVDGLLGALEALIAKKRAIKRAAMQQLLTGKTRLPGFSGEWATKQLGRHVTFLRNGTHSRADLTSEGRLRYLHYGDIHTSTEVHLDPRVAPMPCLPTDRAGNLDRLEDGDLILVDASEDVEGIGKSVEITTAERTEVVSGLHTIAARFDKEVLADGFKAYLQFCPTFREHLRRLAAGTKVYATNRAHIASVKMVLPGTEEQIAIATVLSDMDAEIAALEARRDKTRAIKQGMMQQLLTGRIRLVKTEPTVSEEQTEADGKAGKPHSWAFNEAVVISTLAEHFGKEAFPLGRKRYTKLSYLLHRHAERKAEGYLKKAAGPYNPRTKYGGPERIALEKGYIQQHKGPKGHSGFIAAENVAQAEGYFEKWYGPKAVRWLEQFRFKKNDELEVLATVDMAAEELLASGKSVDVAAVKDVIASHPEWEAKLNRADFSDAIVAEAIQQSDRLFRSSGERSR